MFRLKTTISWPLSRHLWPLKSKNSTLWPWFQNLITTFCNKGSQLTPLKNSVSPREEHAKKSPLNQLIQSMSSSSSSRPQGGAKHNYLRHNHPPLFVQFHVHTKFGLLLFPLCAVSPDINSADRRDIQLGGTGSAENLKCADLLKYFFDCLVA